MIAKFLKFVFLYTYDGIVDKLLRLNVNDAFFGETFDALCYRLHAASASCPIRIPHKETGDYSYAGFPWKAISMEAAWAKRLPDPTDERIERVIRIENIPV